MPPPPVAEAETAGPAPVGLNGRGKIVNNQERNIKTYFHRDTSYNKHNPEVKNHSGSNLNILVKGNIVKNKQICYKSIQPSVPVEFDKLTKKASSKASRHEFSDEDR